MPTVAGVLGVEIGSISFACDETAKYSDQTREYTEINVGTGFGGVECKGVSPFIEVTVRLDEGQPVSDLRIRNETVILRCMDRTVTLTMGYLVGKTENDVAKNSVSCRFAGLRVTEVF